MPSDQTERIEQAAADPAAASVDGQSVTERPLGELIETDQYLAGKTALSGTNRQGGKKSAWGLTRPARGVPPGAG